MTILIIDASVAVKWFVQEDRSDMARALVGERLAAPDVLLAEVFNAVRRNVRRGVVPAATLDDVLPVSRRVIATLTLTTTLIDAGAGLSRRLDHPIYDCLYLALAEREGAPLVTADERQYAAARKVRIEARML